MGDLTKSSFYILQEIGKISLCIFMLIITNQMSDEIKKWELFESLRVALVPAGLYILQNFLKMKFLPLADNTTLFSGLSPSSTFNLESNFKRSNFVLKTSAHKKIVL